MKDMKLKLEIGRDSQEKGTGNSIAGSRNSIYKGRASWLEEFSVVLLSGRGCGGQEGRRAAGTIMR
jgi:hypothetical protein